MCLGCGALERHRLIKLALAEHPLPAEARVLHVAPEPAIARLLPARHYRSADRAPGRADLELDLESIDLPDGSVDVVVANHVLEHVGDDRRALREIRRILCDGGWAILTVPLVEGWDQTYEDHDVPTTDRELHFGQIDHVRYYGRDFRSRILGSGFTLSEFVATGGQCVRFGLMRGERVFLAKRTGP